MIHFLLDIKKFGMVDDEGTSDDNVLQPLWVTQGYVQLSFEYQGQAFFSALNNIVPVFDHDCNKKAFFMLCLIRIFCIPPCATCPLTVHC